MLDNYEKSVDQWPMRVHYPKGNGPFPVILMLHGWTGDENSMWVFTSRIPASALVIAPRALYPAEIGGYSWHPPIVNTWPSVNDFQPSMRSIVESISVRNFPEGDFSDFNLIGFSQGAALAYSMTILFPERIASLVGLSGFMPEGATEWLSSKRMKGLPVFIAHGTKDHLVPVNRARTSVELLEKSGALVTYCEDDVGHKLSAKCFHSLEAFYMRLNI